MVDNDNFNGLIKLSKGDLTFPDYHSLITGERTEKLELLIHLITHLSQPIIVCGPKGIGKTTLLDALQEHQSASWQYCVISGTPGLSLETLQQTLQQQAMTLAVSKRTASPHQKTVLLIDNAGLLVPGLIASIMQYAAGNPKLRVVFALTPDELYIKNSTETLLNECHVIEIPTLSEKQCGEFLRYLATKPSTRLSANMLNDDAGAAIYRQTHGIPGNIIATLPKLTHPPKQDRTLPILISAVILLVAITLAIQWRGPLKIFFVQLTEQKLTGHNPPTP